MSTSFIPVDRLDEVCRRLELRCEAISESRPAEYRVMRVGEHSILFMGNAGRVSDFLTGWARSRNIQI